MILKRALPLLVTMVAIIAVPSTASADFGFSSFSVAFTNADGSVATQAGSHPYAMTTLLTLNHHLDQQEGRQIPDGEMKNLTVQLPAGFTGNPRAVPYCSNKDFLFDPVTERIDCPDDTAVGVIALQLLTPGGYRAVPVFNLQPPPGVAARFGFNVSSVPVALELSVKDTSPYNVVATLTNISQTVYLFGSQLEVWGDPASAVHDPYRGSCLSATYDVANTQFTSKGDCPTSTPESALFTLPTSCTGPLVTSYEVESWQEPSNLLTGSSESQEGGEPAPMSGCNTLGFDPTISTSPTTKAVESPSGLDFGLGVQDEGLTSGTGLSQSSLKQATVTLPEGMSVNPALAEGLSACSGADLARETISSAAGEGCPNESKIGTVEVETPLLEQTLKGSLYLATPYENPFGSLIALYVVVKNPETGVLLKLPVRSSRTSPQGSS